MWHKSKFFYACLCVSTIIKYNAIRTVGDWKLETRCDCLNKMRECLKNYTHVDIANGYPQKDGVIVQKTYLEAFLWSKVHPGKK